MDVGDSNLPMAAGLDNNSPNQYSFTLDADGIPLVAMWRGDAAQKDMNLNVYEYRALKEEDARLSFVSSVNDNETFLSRDGMVEYTYSGEEKAPGEGIRFDKTHGNTNAQILESLKLENNFYKYPIEVEKGEPFISTKGDKVYFPTNSAAIPGSGFALGKLDFGNIVRTDDPVLKNMGSAELTNRILYSGNVQKNDAIDLRDGTRIYALESKNPMEPFKVSYTPGGSPLTVEEVDQITASLICAQSHEFTAPKTFSEGDRVKGTDGSFYYATANVAFRGNAGTFSEEVGDDAKSVLFTPAFLKSFPNSMKPQPPPRRRRTGKRLISSTMRY